jgi:energy-coupling factor transporter ATP-binding protein EcfA2
MFRFGLKNMRRLKDVPAIEIRPVTLLVGKNSSGKSTFLRTFPLIRQSINTRTSSPILWYGDLVDFGQFSSVVTGGEDSRKIKLSFGLDSFHSASRVFTEFGYRSGKKIDLKVDVDLDISGLEGRTRLESFSISFPDINKIFDIELGSSGELTKIKIDDVDVSDFLSAATVRFSLGSLFPEMVVRAKSDKPEHYVWYSENWWAMEQIVKLVKAHVHQRMGMGKLNAFANAILDLESFDNATLQVLEREVSNGSFRKLVSDLRGRDLKKLRPRVEQIYLLNKLISSLGPVFTELKVLLSKTLYIGPMRARSERYYRYQDLAVSEIDPDGKNFPMFLNSLNQSLRADFSEWVKRQFGYGVQVVSESGHISINLEFGSDVSNIVDNGYGISQVLPVLGQIWWASRGARTRYNSAPRSEGATIVIEQPELHLHPAHQALLADAIVGERNADAPYEHRVKFIVETHSEALVNRLGQLISKGAVPNEDVQVLIFEDQEDEAITNVRIATFDEEGGLQNWPFGFFEPTVY